ncbi:agmatinase family protein [Draconibacterium halophilum]|uniref:Agmatinase family protein n=1 Tax=Draconibacterium halophilum TaxID=2706887 RepID=A0A6C0RBV5_9BACT|nr:agmatinase family protein [Draconibacterium halophilum]QIA07486.1 agmatinase family protein [Draconibacterium halophilum]
MSETFENKDFNPNRVGLKNGNFIGLPYDEDSAEVVLLPVPWDVTVSYGEGTALAPAKILEASSQLDLFDPDVKDAWKRGIYFQPVSEAVLEIRNKLRPKAARYINFLENGGTISENETLQQNLLEINQQCEAMNFFVYRETTKLLDAGKIVGLVGGDHSTPLGYFKALSEKYDRFGVVQIDAHLDLRSAYEGFTYSHASVFYNAVQMPEIKKLAQVGIRDCCDEEVELAEKDDRIEVYFDQKLKEEQFKGATWDEQCDEIISELPGNIYISFDVDGLNPKLCPQTGTPVPGGLEYNQVVFLFKKILESGRRIIGFDVCETGNAEWDANVAARIIYKLSCLAG